MLTRASALAVLAALVALVTGCGSTSSDAGSSNLPDASSLVNTASASMRGVSSAHFDLTVTGTLPGVPVQDATGDLNSSGQAKGSAKLSEFGQLVQVDFVLINKTIYVKGPTGGYQTFSVGAANGLFDPSAILDPNRGVAKVVGTLHDAHTDKRESVDGVDTYRVSGQVDKDVAATLVPGIDSNVSTTLWVTADDKHLPVKVEFAVPGSGGASGATVDMTMSQVNQPVSVSAPS